MEDNLYDLSIVHGAAKKRLHDFWRTCLFRTLLIENLRSNKRILDPPSEDFPRLRSYRGQGPHVEMLSCCPHAIEPLFVLSLSIHYVEAGIDSWMESEGCPGAEIQDVREYLYIPENLIKKTTKTGFEAWVKDHNAKRFETARNEAIKTIEQLQKKYKIGKGDTE